MNPSGAIGRDLVLLAAGLGRRFGGLKQLAPVGPSGEAILDYTVYDALRAGFDRILLVVRPEIESEVRAHAAAGFGRRVAMETVLQRLDDLPGSFRAPAGRERPWGTGHAVWAAARRTGGYFAVANADDLYGRDSLAAMGTFLAEPRTEPPTWAMVGYAIASTLPPEGAVSRALISVESGYLRSIDEAHAVRRHRDGAVVDDGSDGPRVVAGDTPVSMNLWGFTEDVLPALDAGLERFVRSRPGDDGEYYLPAMVGEAVRERVACVRVLPTSDRWCGITSAADLSATRGTIAALVESGAYPRALWG